MKMSNNNNVNEKAVLVISVELLWQLEWWEVVAAEEVAASI